jgi:hypothetical protein
MKSQRGQALHEFALVTVFVALLVIVAALLIFGSSPNIGPGAGHNGYSRLME